MMVDDRSAADVWDDWGDWQDWEDEHTSPLGFEDHSPHRDNRSLIQRLAASPDIQIVWRAARAPGAQARPYMPR